MKKWTINIGIWYDEIKEDQSLQLEEALNLIALLRTKHLSLYSITFKLEI